MSHPLRITVAIQKQIFFRTVWKKLAGELSRLFMGNNKELASIKKDMPRVANYY